MPREFDIRDHTIDRATDDRVQQLNTIASEVSQQLPGSEAVAVASVDARSGNPATVTTVNAQPVGDDLVSAALQHLRSIQPVLGIAATPEVNFRADPHVAETTGARRQYTRSRYSAGSTSSRPPRPSASHPTGSLMPLSARPLPLRPRRILRRLFRPLKPWQFPANTSLAQMSDHPPEISSANRWCRPPLTSGSSHPRCRPPQRTTMPNATRSCVRRRSGTPST